MKNHKLDKIKNIKNYNPGIIYLKDYIRLVFSENTNFLLDLNIENDNSFKQFSKK